MDAIKAVRYYVDKMVSSTPGIKVLLLDADTVAQRNPVLSNGRSSSRLVFADTYRLAGFHNIAPLVT